jgi:hypothetical protein
MCLFLARQPPAEQGLPINEVSRSHPTTRHSQYDSAGRVISSSQRPLTTHRHPCPVRFENTTSAGQRPQTHALDHAATGTGKIKCTALNYARKSENASPILTDLPSVDELRNMFPSRYSQYIRCKYKSQIMALNHKWCTVLRITDFCTSIVNYSY